MQKSKSTQISQHKRPKWGHKDYLHLTCDYWAFCYWMKYSAMPFSFQSVPFHSSSSDGFKHLSSVTWVKQWQKVEWDVFPLVNEGETMIFFFCCFVDTCIGGRQLIGSPPRRPNTWRALWKLGENESCLSRRGPPRSAGRLAALSAVFYNVNREFGAVGASARGRRNQRGWWYNFHPMSHLIHSAEGGRTYLQSDFSYTCAAVAA